MKLNLSKLENLKISGGRITARCPACAETGLDTSGNHLFINTSDGRFGCVMYQSIDGTDHRKRIFEMVGESEDKQTTDPALWTACFSAPPSAPFPVLSHYKHGTPIKNWIYRRDNGEIAGIVARFDTPDGKQTLPMTYCKNEQGRSEWRWKAMLEPRPLMNLPFKNQTIVLVEGEKCAEAVTAAGFTATSWAGGAAAIHKTDFSTLTGKTVIIWPDNDQPGRDALRKLQEILKPIASDIIEVNIPRGMPDGWDAADTTPGEIARIINGEPDPEPEPELELDEPIFEPCTIDEDRHHGLPFRFLGVADGSMRYLADQSLSLVSLTPSAHTKLNLMQLAPLQDWVDAFPCKNGVDWDAACNLLIQKSLSLPMFDPRLIRGRGCWIDGDDVVYHAGDKLAVNGTITPITQYKSSTRSVYEAGLRIPIDTANAATDAESIKLVNLCRSLLFDDPLSGVLLAGWMALAPVCGALPWRPHIWITGAAGTGKSWITGNIIYPLVGKSSIYVKGNTSEAGIRGSIGCDSLPVLFDEAEAENHKSMGRMESVLELARQASSEDGGGIIKGTQSGGSITYKVRSMFCFASIGVAAVKKADTSRITVLSLKKADGPEQFNKVKALWRDSIALSGYCERIRARSVAGAITIQTNAAIFSELTVEHTGDKRSADQIGTLLAGAYSLSSMDVVKVEDAKKWLASLDWSTHQVCHEDSDESQCLCHLLSSMVRVERNNGVENLSVEEVIENARQENSLGSDGAALRRIGIRIKNDEILIANSHQGLERCFSDTPWAGAKWRGQLLRISGAYKVPHPVRFGPFSVQKVVSVPLQVIDNQ
jgi:putative DNA primase/helicase